MWRDQLHRPSLDAIAIVQRIAVAGAVATAIVLIGSASFDFEKDPGAAMGTLALASFVFGYLGGMEFSPAAGLLVALPPIAGSLPEDPWLGLLTLFFFGLFAGMAVVSALFGGLVARVVRGISRVGEI